MSGRREALDYARSLVAEAGDTVSSVETVSDEGSPPIVDRRISRTAAAVSVLVEVVHQVTRELEDVRSELRHLREREDRTAGEIGHQLWVIRGLLLLGGAQLGATVLACGLVILTWAWR